MTTAPAVPAAAQGAATPPRLPRLRDVLRAQLRATAFSLRVPMLIAAAIGVVSLLLVSGAILFEDAVADFHAQPSPLPGLVGALLPIAVWAREERFGPGFLWTLPVDRTRHALLKVLAGWLWLMGGVALFVLAQLVLTLVSDGRVLPEETLRVLAAPVASRSQVDPSALQAARWAPGPMIWAVPFAAATATYLLVSALVLGSRRPLLWVLGAVLAFPAATIGSHMASRAFGVESLADAPERALEMLARGRFGLDALLTARTALLDDRAILTTGERILAWSAVPTIADWAIAALLWTGAGLLAVLAAASRHRERRRP